MTETDNALAVYRPRTAEDIRHQVNLIQEVMREVMTDGEHYGKIPGCGDKPALLKAGAEKLGLTFRLIPTLRIEKTELGNGHREYAITCGLSTPTGEVVGEGVGCCSTMESKYRWRSVDNFEVTDQRIPDDAKEKKAEYRKKGFGMKKVDSGWVWVRYTGTGERQENADIADTYNTVLKMAKKRAFVDAILTATAASDIFTQDIEEQGEAAVVEAPAKPSPAPKPAPPPANRAAIADAICKTMREARTLPELETAYKTRPANFSEIRDEHRAKVVQVKDECKLAILKDEIDALATSLEYDVVKLSLVGQGVGVSDIDSLDCDSAAKLLDALRKEAEASVPV